MGVIAAKLITCAHIVSPLVDCPQIWSTNDIEQIKRETNRNLTEPLTQTPKSGTRELSSSRLMTT